MITLPIWLFVLCVILGFPLVIGVLIVIGFPIYIGVKISIELLKSIWYGGFWSDL